MDTIETEKPSLTYRNQRNQKIDELRHRTEDFVREEPVKAVGIALAAGMFLTIFPVFALLSGMLRLVFSLLKPVLLVFGAVKLYDEITTRYGE